MDYSQYTTLKVDISPEGIMVLGLNRPEKLNAVDEKMVDELNDLLFKLNHDKEVKVVILKGEGEKGFCGGLEIQGIMPKLNNVPGLYDFTDRLTKVVKGLRTIPQPVIAAVHGAAVGAGFMFALAADIRVIAPDAKFSAAFIKVGIGGADMGSTYLIPRVLGAGIGNELILTGRMMLAEEAQRLGFVSRCVDKAELLENAMEIARDIAAKDPIVITMTKLAINQGLDTNSLDEVISFENRQQSLIIMHNVQLMQAARQAKK